MFLVEKCNGDIKARGCTDGRKYIIIYGYKKEDAKSPTISNEGVVIPCAI